MKKISKIDSNSEYTKITSEQLQFRLETDQEIPDSSGKIKVSQEVNKEANTHLLNE